MTPLIVILWLAFGLCSGMVSQAKGRSFGSSFLWGVLLGPLGLLIALCERPAPRAPTAVMWPQPGFYWCNGATRYWNGWSWIT